MKYLTWILFAWLSSCVWAMSVLFWLIGTKYLILPIGEHTFKMLGIVLWGVLAKVCFTFARWIERDILGFNWKRLE
jgi:hypothetical protein